MTTAEDTGYGCSCLVLMAVAVAFGGLVYLGSKADEQNEGARKARENAAAQNSTVDEKSLNDYRMARMVTSNEAATISSTSLAQKVETSLISSNDLAKFVKSTKTNKLNEVLQSKTNASALEKSDFVALNGFVKGSYPHSITGYYHLKDGSLTIINTPITMMEFSGDDGNKYCFAYSAATMFLQGRAKVLHKLYPNRKIPYQDLFKQSIWSNIRASEEYVEGDGLVQRGGVTYEKEDLK